MHTLKPGEHRFFIVNSWHANNHSRVYLLKDGVYTISVEPQKQTWTDGRMPWKQTCDANGFSHPILDIFSRMKRYRDAKWFTLMGKIQGTRGSSFVIGTGVSGFKAKSGGELVCYANDARRFYKNNSGSLAVRVTRIE